jgi:zeaxanthin glucosyltransferase
MTLNELMRERMGNGMKRFGIFCLPGRGHIYPATALGRELRDRGHRVTVFNSAITRGLIRDSGLYFQQLGGRSVSASNPRRQLPKHGGGLNTVDVMYKHATLILTHGLESLQRETVDALLVDQADLAGGSVADALGIPFVSVSFFPPVYCHDANPPFIYGWSPTSKLFGQARIREANSLFCDLFSPIIDLVNSYRDPWKLPELKDLNDTFSTRAIISQMPKAFEFARIHMPDCLHYTGPFEDGAGRRRIQFPWERLNGLPIVYASMGTVRNSCVSTFQIIAEALARFDVQLVISLGGTGLVPEDLLPLPGDPIVVHYAPQLNLIAKSAVTICHGGMNTSLECVANGVPMIVIPVSDDQPGVAARIRKLGIGLVIPYRKLSVKRLEEHVRSLLVESKYRVAVEQMRDDIAKLGGLRLAADIVEKNTAFPCEGALH